MTRRIIALAALFLVAGAPPALAQSTTATTGTTKPSNSAAASGNTLPNGQPKWQPPPAARSGGQGLRIDNDANNSGWVDIKRNK
jgi:hypothetical protein